MSQQPLSHREQKALNRYERHKQERLRWTYYATIPAKHWNQMSGRQAKVIREQATRYGIPFDGAAINLPAVVRALHDFLADNAVRLNRDDDALIDSGPASPALERYREEKALLAKLERQEREGSLILRAQLRVGLARLAATLRGAAVQLQQQFGSEAVDLYYEALDEAQRQIDGLFAPHVPLDEELDGSTDMQVTTGADTPNEVQSIAGNAMVTVHESNGEAVAMGEPESVAAGPAATDNR